MSLGHQVDLGAGTGPFHYNKVMGAAQTVKRRTALAEEILFFGVIRLRGGVHPGDAVEHHLGADVADRFEQHRIHVAMGRDPGRLGLDDLGPAHLRPLGRDAGVVRHVLGLERRHPESPVGKDPAQGGGDNGLAHIRTGPQHGQAGCFF